MKKITDRIAGGVMTVLSLLLTIGVRTVFSACGPKEDGSWMTCHWAQQAVFMTGIALTVISVIVLIFGSHKAALGASLAAIPVSITAALTPGIAINLCMMTNMHCHTVMRPAVTVISAMIAVAAAAEAAIQISGGKKKR